MNAVEKIDNYLCTLKQKPDYFQIILKILIQYNCRITEVLEADWHNFYSKKYLILPGLKHSCAIIIRDKIILENINSLPRIHLNKIFPGISYYTIYHYIKKNFSHLFINIKHKKNLKVTHAFRYLNVENIKDEIFVREILHHRSVKSGTYYTNKIKESYHG